MYDSVVRDTNSDAVSGPVDDPVAGEPAPQRVGPVGTVGRPGISARGLGKRFGASWAVRDLDLDVGPGTVMGLLGHNGAGKSTTIRMLTTLSRPTTGTATVAGFDVATAADQVRRSIGVAAQQATVDDLLTARANLEMVGRLSGLRAPQARHRAAGLLEQMDLLGAADDVAKTFSGGMRRRLDLAAALVNDPPVLFLDEPTTGLDPRSRNDLWDILRDRVRSGVTLLLTTQYLDEADRLADDIVVMDHGRAVASGTPDELKARLAGDRIEVTLASPDLAPGAAEVLGGLSGAPTGGEGAVVVGSLAAEHRLSDVLRAFDVAGIDVVDISRHRPTLDDVFLSLTDSNGGPRS